MNAVQQISRITMICSEPDRLADFYKAAFGFVQTADVIITDSAFAQLIDIPGAIARVITLRLGGQEIELAGIQPPGRNYPRGVSGRSVLFQHFAIVVSDMVICLRTTVGTQGMENNLDRWAAVVARFIGRRHRA